jgi:hypothetical protein
MCIRESTVLGMSLNHVRCGKIPLKRPGTGRAVVLPIDVPVFDGFCKNLFGFGDVMRGKVYSIYMWVC